MEEFRLQLSQIQNMPNKDVIIARTIVRNGWAQAEPVLAAAREVAADVTGPSLLRRLTDAGVIAEQRARQIDEALQRKLVERGAAPSQDSPAECAASPEAAARELWLAQDGKKRIESRVFFDTYLRSKLHEDVMDAVVASGGEAIDPETIAADAGASREQVQRLLAQWRDVGLLERAEKGQSRFLPSPRDKKDIERHVLWWRDADERARCVETAREEAYAQCLADAQERLAQTERSLRDERASRSALESKLRSSTEELMSSAAQVEQLRAAADAIGADVNGLSERLAASQHMVSLKDQLVAQLMGEKESHRALEREYAVLLAKYKELVAQLEKAENGSRRVERVNSAGWTIRVGTSTVPMISRAS